MGTHSSLESQVELTDLSIANLEKRKILSPING